MDNVQLHTNDEVSYHEVQPPLMPSLANSVGRTGSRNEQTGAAENANKQTVSTGDGQGQKTIDQLIEAYDKQFQQYNRRLSFSYDEQSQQTVIQVLNRDTGELIRQIPAEEMLKTKTKVASIMGLIVDTQI